MKARSNFKLSLISIYILLIFCSCKSDIEKEFGVSLNKSFSECEEEWSDFNGDGYKLCSLTLNKEELIEKKKKCDSTSFNKLPIEGLTEGVLFSRIKNETGCYSIIKKEDETKILVILDSGTVYYFLQIT